MAGQHQQVRQESDSGAREMAGFPFLPSSLLEIAAHSVKSQVGRDWLTPLQTAKSDYLCLVPGAHMVELVL